MINLLSTQKKADIRAARANTILLRYIAILVLALLFIGGILYISYESLRSSEKSADTQLALYGHSTPNNTQTIYQKNKISTLLPAIGQALPTDTTLGSFKVSNTIITLEIHSKEPFPANEAQERMAMVNALIVNSVSESIPSTTISGYSYKTTITANLRGEN